MKPYALNYVTALFPPNPDGFYPYGEEPRDWRPPPEGSDAWEFCAWSKSMGDRNGWRVLHHYAQLDPLVFVAYLDKHDLRKRSTELGANCATWRCQDGRSIPVQFRVAKVRA